MSMTTHPPVRLSRTGENPRSTGRVTVKYVYTRRSAVVQSLGPKPSPMTRMPVYILAAFLAAAPLSAAAQDRGDRAEARQERRANGGGGGALQNRPDREDRGETGGRRERPSREQSEQSEPRVSMGAAVQRASSGRPGRFLGASNRGDTIVVRWEYPGGRVADIMVDGRTGRVIGER